MLLALSLSFALALPVQGDEVAAKPGLEALVEKVESAAANAKDGATAMAAIKAAAESALEEHKAELATGDGVFYRGLLLARADQSDLAFDTLVKFAKENEKNPLASRARLEAILVGMGDRDQAEIQKLADSTDTESLDEQQKKMLTSIKGRLADDATRAALDGQPAPAFETTRVMNGAFDMNALKGKVVVFDFWATWCPPCRAVIPELVELQKQHPKDLQVVGLTRLYTYGMDFSDPNATKPHGGKSVGRPTALTEDEEVAVNEAFIKAFEVNYPIVFTGPEVGKDLSKVRGIPTVFVIGKDGKVIGNSVGAGEASHKKLMKLVEQGLAAKPAN